MNRHRVLFLPVVLMIMATLSLGLFSQTRPVLVDPSSAVSYVNDKPYFMHPVLQGQTLFSIARAYAVNQDLILDANPDLVDGLKAGQTIRIPAFTHLVEPRETSFGLSRRYGISLQQMHVFNPDILVDGLQIGMVLYIPGATRQDDAVVAMPAEEVSDLAAPDRMLPAAEPHPTERAEQAETAPTIVTEDDELPVPQNGYMAVPVPDTLITDIPVSDAEGFPVWRISEPCLQAETQAYYQVALLIPLYLDELQESIPIDSIRTLPEGQDNWLTLRHKSFSFLPYYQGVLLALDSIRAQGVDIRLHVFDVDQNEPKARQAAGTPGFADMDLIIGPFFSRSLNYVLGFANFHQIPVISPLLQDQQQLRGHPLLFNAKPSLDTQLDQLARYIGERHAGHNIIFVHNNQPQAMSVISNFRTNLNRELAKRGHPASQLVNPSALSAANTDTLPASPVYFSEHIHIREGMSGLVTKLDVQRKNVIITLVGGEAFLSNYLRELNMHTANFDLQLYGIPDWKEYQSIEIDYLQNLQVHIFTPDYHNYSDQHIRDFVRRYRSEFGTEPSYDAFRAAHTAYYFFSALALYGKMFPACINQMNSMTYNSAFYFRRPFGPQGGWENGFFNLVTFKNFSTIEVLRN